MSPSALRTASLLFWAATAGAVAAAACGCIPFEWLKPLGQYVRRPDDVTPERYARYLQLCWFFAAGLSIAAILLRRFRNDVAIALNRAGSDVREAAISLRPTRAWLGLPLVVIAAGAAVRLWLLDGPIGYDEAYTFLNFARRPWYEAISDYNSPNNHLLNTFLMHWCYRVFGQQEWALRLPVFVAGTLLIGAVYLWAKELFGRNAALIAAAFVAVSPALVTYSVDARGYSFVALFAVMLDFSLRRIDEDACWPGVSWMIGWMAMVLGLASMPIMVYPVMGSLGWFAVAGRHGPLNRQRLVRLVVFCGTGVLAVALLYAPAYIFRGLMFLSDSVMDVGRSAFWSHVLPGWKGAFDWWTAGFLPWFVWVIGIGAGALELVRRPRYLIQMLLPFVAVLLINVLKQVSPPERVYLFLAPWIYAIVGLGTARALDLVSRWALPARVVTLAILAAGTWYATSRPVLFNEHERSAFVSVEELIAHLDSATDGNSEGNVRLLVPLPADLPSLFYLERRGFSVAINGEPAPGDDVWLVARRGKHPEDTLADGLVNLEAQAEQLGPWRLVRRFETLSLYRSMSGSE